MTFSSKKQYEKKNYDEFLIRTYTGNTKGRGGIKRTLSQKKISRLMMTEIA